MDLYLLAMHCHGLVWKWFMEDVKQQVELKGWSKHFNTKIPCHLL